MSPSSSSLSSPNSSVIIDPSLTAREKANKVERERDERMVNSLRKDISDAYASVSKHGGRGYKELPEEKKGLADIVTEKEGYMMSAQNVSSRSPYRMCMSRYEHPLGYLNVNVPDGCISLFTNDVSTHMYSYVTTYCGCEDMGPRMYDLNALVHARLVNKDNYEGVISYIATGSRTSIAIYNSPIFGNDVNASEYKAVYGPNRYVSLSSQKMGNSGFSWDDQVYSIVIDSWSSCDASGVPCNPVTTQSPVTNPTMSPVEASARAVHNAVTEIIDTDRLAEREGERDPAFINFISNLESIEESYEHSHAASSGRNRQKPSSSSPSSLPLSSPVIPMSFQVKGDEAWKDQERSAYFEDEEDNYTNGKLKRKSKNSRRGYGKYNEVRNESND